MIDNNSLEIEWLEQVSEQNNKVDKILVEKVIRAMMLLEGLSKSGLVFVFKGGTSLMLLLSSLKRLSIDIDIIVENRFDFKTIFDNILSEYEFTRFDESERKTESKIKKTHYKLFYNPSYKTSQTEEYILLDVLFEKHHYKHLKEITISSPFLKVSGKANKVKIPSANELLGDKLTAFAPNTTGVPYKKGGKNRSLEIIKQLYDIGCLFDKFDSLPEVSEIFLALSEIEADYRNMQLESNDILTDIYETSFCLVTRGRTGNGDFKILAEGIKSIKSYIFSEPYNIDRAIIDASKAAYLSILLKHNQSEYVKFNDPLKMKGWIIEQPHDTKLNKLKKSNPEAFFYWYQIYNLLK
jgi:hypothetical protein